MISETIGEFTIEESIMFLKDPSSYGFKRVSWKQDQLRWDYN